MTVTTALRPYVLAKDGGKLVNHFGGPLIFKATAPQTNGAVGVIEQVAPPGGGTPLHIHSREDESLYVLEGRLTVLIDGKESVVGPGSYVFLPRGIAHAWCNERPEPARFIAVFTPGGFESFYNDIAVFEDATEGIRPGREWIAQCLTGYGVEIVG
jgi:quercetin dioxygenase-like cupin family protein